VDSSAVSRTKVVVDRSLRRGMRLRGYKQRSELLFTNSVSDEKAACGYGADVPPLMSVAFVSLLAVGAGRGTLLRSGSEAAMVPAEDGCSIISRG
jgi:hypothetical protein